MVDQRKEWEQEQRQWEGEHTKEKKQRQQEEVTIARLKNQAQRFRDERARLAGEVMGLMDKRAQLVGEGADKGRQDGRANDNYRGGEMSIGKGAAGVPSARLTTRVEGGAVGSGREKQMMALSNVRQGVSGAIHQGVLAPNTSDDDDEIQCSSSPAHAM